MYDTSAFRLEIVTGPPFAATCYGCRARMEHNPDKGRAPFYADLNGPAFVAYFCGDCTRRIKAGDMLPYTADPTCGMRDYHHNGERCDACKGVA